MMELCRVYFLFIYRPMRTGAKEKQATINHPIRDEKVMVGFRIILSTKATYSLRVERLK